MYYNNVSEVGFEFIYFQLPKLNRISQSCSEVLNKLRKIRPKLERDYTESSTGSVVVRRIWKHYGLKMRVGRYDGKLKLIELEGREYIYG